MNTEHEWTLQEIDEALYSASKDCIGELHADQPPLIMTFIGEQTQTYPLAHMMHDREQIGELFSTLVRTPGIDFVVQIGQGYGISINEDDPKAVEQLKLWKSGVAVKDIPGRREIVTVTIFDKTKAQCEAWSSHHEVIGHQLIRGKLTLCTGIGGKMMAAIPRA